MSQFILSIPDWAGWILVGFTAGGGAYVLYRLALVLIGAVREYKELKIEMENEMKDGD